MKLPNRRHSWTQAFSIAGTKVYLGMGEYDNGSLGEIFVVVDRAGSALRAVLDSFAIVFSISLRNGSHLTELLNAIEDTDFQPQGRVYGLEDLGITEARSIIDAVAKILRRIYA